MHGKKIIVGVGPRLHMQLAHDEIAGLKNLGYNCEEVVYGNNNQSIGPLAKLGGVLKNAFNIVKHLYRFSPDILYLNSRLEPVASSRDGISITLIKLLYWKRLKIVIKTHGSDFTLLEKKTFFSKHFLIPVLVNKVDAWFFLSSDEKDMLHNMLPQLKGSVAVIPNIIESSRFVPSLDFRKKYLIKEENYNIFFAARMVLEKGCLDLVESIPYITLPDVDTQKMHFYLAGDGVALPTLKEKCKELKIENRVHFLGQLEEEECDQFFPNVNLVVFPTYYNEGFPMGLFKAVGAGLPVITTKIRAAKDYLVEPENVIWVEPRSPRQIADAITAIYTNPVMGKQMSNNNKELSNRFSTSKVCELIDANISATFKK